MVPSCGLDLHAHVNMSRLRFAVLFTASSFGVLLLAASASSSSSSRSSEVHSVGDETGHAAPPGNHEGAQQTLSKWTMGQRFYIGDVLDFKRWSGPVLLVRKGDYDRCSAASPVRRSADGGGNTRFTLARPGLFYFISGAPARCEVGERVVVRVVDPLNNSGAPTPTPAPAPGTQPDAILSRRRSRPRSIAEMQMVAGAIGFAVGFVTMFLIVGLFIFCWR